MNMSMTSGDVACVVGGALQEIDSRIVELTNPTASVRGPIAGDPSTKPQIFRLRLPGPRSDTLRPAHTDNEPSQNVDRSLVAVSRNLDRDAHSWANERDRATANAGSRSFRPQPVGWREVLDHEQLPKLWLYIYHRTQQ